MIFGIEGAPGAGKSTVIQRLEYPSVPEMLVSPEEEATFTENDYLKHENRKHELAQGMGKCGVCLMDRTRLSHYAYRYGNGELDSDELPVPYPQDNMHYIYLSVPPHLSLERRLPGLWTPSVDFTKRVIDFYETQFEAMGEHVTRVDATQSTDDVVSKINRTIRAEQQLAQVLDEAAVLEQVPLPSHYLK